MKKIIVFYHKNCTDGFGAAWAAWKKFGNKAEYVAIQPNQTSNQLGVGKIKNKEVYFLDVCASREKLLELKKNNNLTVVIDHHITNKETVKNADKSLFDIKHSGSALSWMYFHPNKNVPWLLRYIEDADLWNHKIPYADEISAQLFLLDFDFATWEKLAKNFEISKFRKNYAKDGKLIIKYENKIIKEIIKESYSVIFCGHNARVVNTSVSHSTVGNILIDKNHPVGITWYENDKFRRYSLRSSGKMDVSKLAKKFPGGGGHANAAGFTLPANKPFPWKIIKTKDKKPKTKNKNY